MKIESIPVKDIDMSSPGWDEYIFTYPVAAGPVKDSIESVGLQQPIIVAKQKEQYRIVVGIRRLLACKELDWQEIPAIVCLHGQTEELLWLSLQEKVGSRQFNTIEKSRILQKFADLWQGDVERLQKELCPLLEIPPTVEAVETYLFMKEVPEAQREELAKGKLTPNHIELLKPMRPEDRDAAAEKIFGPHRVSFQEAREIIENAVGLAARDGTRVADVFERPEVKDIFVRENQSPRKRTSLLRTWLHQERFPRLSALEDEFTQLAEMAAAGEALTIKPPRDFEGDAISVSFRARAATEVSQFLLTMEEAESKGLWKKLFTVLKGDDGDDDDPDEDF